MAEGTASPSAPATAGTQRPTSASKVRLEQTAGDRPASVASGAPSEPTASAPTQAAGISDTAAADTTAADTGAGPGPRDSDGRDGVAAAASPGQGAVGSPAVTGANADPSAAPSQVPSILQSGAPSPIGMAAPALTTSAAPVSPNAAPAAPPIGDLALQGLTSTATSPSSSATTSTASSAPQAAHVPPASQLAPALLSLATSATGTQRLTMRLQPDGLGTVEVRIDRPADAPAHVDIGVSRPETLTLMLRDQAQLQHTLDQAGVPAEGRTISFHLTGQDADSMSRQAGGFGQSASDGQSMRDGPATRNGSATRGATDADENVKLMSPGPLQWQRAGLDITA
jgi:flagellar hook-length control protein FliK